MEQANYPRFNGENLEKNKLLYTRVSNLAIKHGCTVPQLALAWLLHQGHDIVPIPGMLCLILILLTKFWSVFICFCFESLKGQLK